jgi:hypothetical protein
MTDTFEKWFCLNKKSLNTREVSIALYHQRFVEQQLFIQRTVLEKAYDLIVEKATECNTSIPKSIHNIKRFTERARANNKPRVYTSSFVINSIHRMFALLGIDEKLNGLPLTFKYATGNPLTPFVYLYYWDTVDIDDIPHDAYAYLEYGFKSYLKTKENETCSVE